MLFFHGIIIIILITESMPVWRPQVMGQIFLSSMILSYTHYQKAAWPYFSTFFAISVVEGIVICFLYSKLDKYKRRSEQWPISTNQVAPVQVAPVQVATVTQPQTVVVNGQSMRVVSNGNQQVVTTTNNPNMVVYQPSQTVRVNQPPSYQVVI